MSKYNNMSNIGEITFYENFNLTKLDYIINNPAKYEDLIKEQEKDMRKTDKNNNAYASMTASFQKNRNASEVPDELKRTEYASINLKKGRIYQR